MGKALADVRALGGASGLSERPQPLVGDGVDARAVEGIRVLALLAGSVNILAVKQSAQPLIPVVGIAPEKCGEPGLGEKRVAGQQLECIETTRCER